MTVTDMIEELAQASGVDPIVVERGVWLLGDREEERCEMWLGGRMVRVEVLTGLTMAEYRARSKSVTVHGARYDFEGAASAIRAYLAGELDEDGDSYLVEPETEIEVDVADLRELLAGASDELRERYAHALDERGLTPGTPRT